MVLGGGYIAAAAAARAMAARAATIESDLELLALPRKVAVGAMVARDVVAVEVREVVLVTMTGVVVLELLVVVVLLGILAITMELVVGAAGVDEDEADQGCHWWDDGGAIVVDGVVGAAGVVVGTELIWIGIVLLGSGARGVVMAVVVHCTQCGALGEVTD